MTRLADQRTAEPLSVLLRRGEPSRPAFVVPDAVSLTYQQAADRIEVLAGQLAGAGVRRGNHVALALPGGPDFVLLLLATALLGAAAAPLNPAYSEREFTF